jgi:predicted ABC-type ATPase
MTKKSLKKPQLLIIAGPNGSGKSTIVGRIPNKPKLYINADDLAKKHGLDNLSAAILADKLRQEALSKGVSFTTETVLSTSSKIELMKDATSKGYEVNLVVVLTHDPDINVERVKSRVFAGGHDVPAEKIVTRYQRFMENTLTEAIRVADQALVYNNSFEKPVLILSKSMDRNIEIYPQNYPSKWGIAALESLRNKIKAPIS